MFVTFYNIVLNAFIFQISPSVNLLKMGFVFYVSLHPQIFAQGLVENTLVGKLMDKWMEIESY